MADRPLRPATDRRLGRPLPHQQANRTQATPKAHHCFVPQDICGISPSFPGLSPTSGHIPTRYSPVRRCHCWPRDLHVLSMPPAFALSQDQTLRFIHQTKPSPKTKPSRLKPNKANPQPITIQHTQPTQTPPPRSHTQTTLHQASQPSSSAARASHPQTNQGQKTTQQQMPKPTSSMSTQTLPKPDTTFNEQCRRTRVRWQTASQRLSLRTFRSGRKTAARRLSASSAGRRYWRLRRSSSTPSALRFAVSTPRAGAGQPFHRSFRILA